MQNLRWPKCCVANDRVRLCGGTENKNLKSGHKFLILPINGQWFVCVHAVICQGTVKQFNEPFGNIIS